MSQLLGRCLTVVCAARLLLPAAAQAQVGHDPAKSPYKTLRYGGFVGLTAGLFNGNGGSLGVIPHHGSTLGLRFDFLSTGTVSIGFSATYARLERLVVNPTRPIETAVSGPIKKASGIAEVILQFNLTGSKTWHHIAPFVSGAVGFMVTSATKQDSSGLSFKNRFVLTPGLGARIFLSERLYLRVAAGTAFWSASYPDSYRTVPSTDITKPPVLIAPNKEWLANGWYTVGLSYAYSWPF